MVDFWVEQIEIAIKRTKRRILLLQRSGNGLSVMEEKANLGKQQKHRADRNA